LDGSATHGHARNDDFRALCASMNRRPQILWRWSADLLSFWQRFHDSTRIRAVSRRPALLLAYLNQETGLIIGVSAKFAQHNGGSPADHCASAEPLNRRRAKAKSYDRKNELRKRRATPKWVALIWPALDSMLQTPGQRQFIG
jgi:hypothetical protein